MKIITGTIAAGLLCVALAVPVESSVRPKNVERYLAVDNVCAWPNLTVLPDGTLTALIFSRPSHGQETGDPDCWASRDGRFWHYRGTVTRHEPETVRMNLASGLASNGDLLVLCSGWTNVQQPGQPKKSYLRDAVIRSWVSRSADGGMTWESRTAFPPAEEGMTELIPFGDILPGADGALRASCYAGSKNLKSWTTSFLRSDDDGWTWERVSEISPKHNETAPFHLGGGKWLAAIRGNGLEMARSDDDGKTWGDIERVTEPGQHPGHLTRLADGRLLLTYGSRVTGKYGVAVKFSEDEGETWSQEHSLVLLPFSADLGYPSSVQRPDGTIVTAYYASREENHNRYHMGVAIWELEEIPESEAIQIGSRLEPFVDDFLIDELKGAELKLHHPTPREVVFRYDQPSEGNISYYTRIFEDDGLFRMYYRGADYDWDTKKVLHQVVCYAESRDGLNWTKPDLGLVEFRGSKKNNIIWNGPGSHNFSPFKDTNPACKPDERYKALGSISDPKGLVPFASADGIHWRQISERPVITDGAFDSQNLAFWDEHRGRYVDFHRHFRDGTRGIKTCTSKDFIHWTDPVWLDYGDTPNEHLYTNTVIAYPRAPHIFTGFPKRFVPQREQAYQPTAKHDMPGLSDTVFMSSRDGFQWNRWREGFLRPGQNKERWWQRNNPVAWGILYTPSLDGELGPGELSFYSNENYYIGPQRLRRYTLRVDGFASLYAGYPAGEIVTKPLRFDGPEGIPLQRLPNDGRKFGERVLPEGRLLLINYATSAAGSVRCEIQDADGRPIPGFTLQDCQEIYGDQIEQPVSWNGVADLTPLSDRPVRLRFVLEDADLYAIRFHR